MKSLLNYIQLTAKSISGQRWVAGDMFLSGRGDGTVFQIIEIDETGRLRYGYVSGPDNSHNPERWTDELGQLQKVTR